MGTNRRYGSPSERPRPHQAADYRPITPKVRHVWVRSGPKGAEEGWPGLVIAWRKQQGSGTTSGWLAQVAYVIGDDDSLHVVWMPAERLQPTE